MWTEWVPELSSHSESFLLPWSLSGPTLFIQHQSSINGKLSQSQWYIHPCTHNYYQYWSSHLTTTWCVNSLRHDRYYIRLLWWWRLRVILNPGFRGGLCLLATTRLEKHRVWIGFTKFLINFNHNFGIVSTNLEFGDYAQNVGPCVDFNQVWKGTCFRLYPGHTLFYQRSAPIGLSIPNNDIDVDDDSENEYEWITSTP